MTEILIQIGAGILGIASGCVVVWFVAARGLRKRRTGANDVITLASADSVVNFSTFDRMRITDGLGTRTLTITRIDYDNGTIMVIRE